MYSTPLNKEVTAFAREGFRTEGNPGRNYHYFGVYV